MECFTDKSFVVVALIMLLLGCNGDEQGNSNGDEGGDTHSDLEDKIEVVKFDSSGLYEIQLMHTKENLIEGNKTLFLGNIESLDLPDVVYLDDIKIQGGYIVNNTPYTINSLYLAGPKLVSVKLSKPLAKYSKAIIDDRWAGYSVQEFTKISNGSVNYAPTTSSRSNSRLPNPTERESTEQFQIYDHYFYNHPKTLQIVTELFTSKCQEIPECKNYKESAKDYASDTYYAKSASGIISNLWIDPDVWGLASKPSWLNYHHSQADHKHQTIWMNPNLMAGLKSDDPDTHFDAWQALAHELNHNYGFSHESGWASGYGMDDLLGEEIVRDYLNVIQNDFIRSDTVIEKVKKISVGKYEVTLGLLSDFDKDITLRLLSTFPIKGEITQKGSQNVVIEFSQIPQTDVYLSVYSEKSAQMSSRPLSFVLSVNSQNSLSSFDDMIENWLTDYDVINVKTSDGSWVREFSLPRGSNYSGKTVEFTSNATFDSSIYHDGTGELLSSGNRVKFINNGAMWIKQ